MKNALMLVDKMTTKHVSRINSQRRKSSVTGIILTPPAPRSNSERL
jgi:hypothetical protein